MKKITNSSEYIRWWELPAALILIAALLTAATRLASTQWPEDLAIIQTITLLGVLAGLALGKSRFSPRVVRLFAFLYGTFVAECYGARTGETGYARNENRGDSQSVEKGTK